MDGPIISGSYDLKELAPTPPRGRRSGIRVSKDASPPLCGSGTRFRLDTPAFYILNPNAVRQLQVEYVVNSSVVKTN